MSTLLFNALQSIKKRGETIVATTPNDKNGNPVIKGNKVLPKPLSVLSNDELRQARIAASSADRVTEYPADFIKVQSVTKPIFVGSDEEVYSKIGFICLNDGKIYKGEKGGRTAIKVLSYIFENFQKDSLGIPLPERYSRPMYIRFGEAKEDFELVNGKVIKRTIYVGNERESQPNERSTWQSGFKSANRVAVLDWKNITEIRVDVPLTQEHHPAYHKKNQSKERKVTDGGYLHTTHPTKSKIKSGGGSTRQIQKNSEVEGISRIYTGRNTKVDFNLRVDTKTGIVWYKSVGMLITIVDGKHVRKQLPANYKRDEFPVAKIQGIHPQTIKDREVHVIDWIWSSKDQKLLDDIGSQRMNSFLLSHQNESIKAIRCMNFHLTIEGIGRRYIKPLLSIRDSLYREINAETSNGNQVLGAKKLSKNARRKARRYGNSNSHDGFLNP